MGEEKCSWPNLPEYKNLSECEAAVADEPAMSKRSVCHYRSTSLTSSSMRSAASRLRAVTTFVYMFIVTAICE